MYAVFFFNDTATTEIYTLSLHDALPIYEAELGWEPPRIERERPSGQRVGVTRLRRLPERAARDLRHEAERSRAVPRQAERTADQQGKDQVRNRTARANPRGREDERRQHGDRERRLGEHAEPQDDAGGDRPATVLEGLDPEQHDEDQGDHRRERKVELKVQRSEERRG